MSHPPPGLHHPGKGVARRPGLNHPGQSKAPRSRRQWQDLDVLIASKHKTKLSGPEHPVKEGEKPQNASSEADQEGGACNTPTPGLD